MGHQRLNDDFMSPQQKPGADANVSAVRKKCRIYNTGGLQGLSVFGVALRWATARNESRGNGSKRE
ncbi:hypothetical protein GCM10027343_25050 [Noviherbaspirillum agri]